MVDSADPTPPDSYWTLAGTSASELKIQRSRFLSSAAPAPEASAARDFVRDQAVKYHDARHVCYAWRIGYGNNIEENRNDAGEPSGTAGEPILQAMRKADLSAVVTVVVRYFGGVKLGTGGLARAYGQAAEAALAAGQRREILLGRRFDATFPYRLQKTMTQLVNAHGGRIETESYGEEVSWRLWLPHATCDRCRQAVTEATAAVVALRPVPE